MALGHGPTVVTDGLVLALDAADRNSYPGSGTTWTDLSGNGNNGTLVNGVGYNSSNGGSLTFDGVDDYVDLGAPSKLINLNANDVTFFCCIYPSQQSTRAAIISPRGDALNELFFGTTGTTSLSLSVDRYPPSGGRADSTLKLNLNAWNIVCASAKNEQQVLFFINNETEVIPHTESFVGSTATKVTIGAQSNPSIQRYFNGNIANVLVYNKALTSKEIQQNYNALKGRFQ